MEVALGDLYAGLFANDDAWREEILAAAEASGDHTWPFPLHHRYRRYIDSAYADMKNASELRQGSPALAQVVTARTLEEGRAGDVGVRPGPLAGELLQELGGEHRRALTQVGRVLDVGEGRVDVAAVAPV